MANPIPYPNEKSSSPLRRRNAVYDAYMESGGLGIGSIFDEEGSSASGFLRTIDDGSMGGERPSSVTEFTDDGAHPLQLQKMIDGGMGVMPIPKMEGLEKALTYIKENAGVNETPLGNLARKRKMTELMESGSEAFAESPLDAIAAQIAKAQLGAQSGANDSEIAQRMIADKNRSAAESVAAEEFRAQEAKSFDDTSMTIADSEKATEDMFKSAMDEFLGMARGASPEKRERTLAEYKEEFAAATGVDVSGKVDKSQALMALGLGLMQNRAGKGFNVGKILNAVGQAGEKALPALEKAKAKAQTAALAAGKYALESRGSDRAKDEATSKDLMNRGKYWVYKKGSKGAEFEGFDSGEFVDLNKYELNKLIENSDFEKQYEFINASDRMAILEKRAEGVDLGDAWDGYERISLIGGKADDVPPELQVLAAAASPNYGGTTPTGYKLGETPETVVRRFGELQKSITSGAAKFESLISAIDSGVSIPDQMVSTVFTGLRNLGFNVGDEPTDIAQARTMLKEIAVREATNILQESGKTLSDNDRKRVEDLVGEISFVSGDAALIKKKLKEIYKLTVEKPQQNLDRAIDWLDQNAGISFGSSADDMPTQAELDAMNKVYGTSYTLDVFKQNGASK